MVDWKKDISLRPKRSPEVEAPAEPPAEAVEHAERVPFWKKEIRLGRKSADAEPSPQAQAPDPVAELEQLARRAIEWAPGPAEVGHEAEHGRGLDRALEPSAATEAEDLVGADAYAWLTAAIDEDRDARSWTERLDEQPPAGPAGDVAGPPAQPPAETAPRQVPTPPVDAAEPPEPAQPAPPPPAASMPAPVFPPPTPTPSPVPAAAPAVPPGIHPPVPAAELPPLPAAEEEAASSSPRRGFAFRRKPGPAGDAEAVPAEQQPSTEKPKPFWRRDLSQGRRRSAGSDPPVAADARAAVPPAKQPEPAESQKQRARRRRRSGERGSARHKRVVGLKIGASQLAAAEVVNNGSAQLVRVARRPLEPGIVVAGELREPDALAAALKEFFAETKLPNRNVRLGIATNRIGVRTLELEGIDDPKQLANAIRFRAQDALPIPIEEAVLDYQVLSESVDEEGQATRRILLVVAYRELIDRYTEACRKAGVRLVGIDLEAFALLRALNAPAPEGSEAPEAATVAVAIGYQRSTFAVSDGRVCEFTRVLEWGGFHLDVALARALDIAPSDAEPLKRQLSLAGGPVPDGLTAEQASTAREAAKREVTRFARELVSSLQFYQNQPGSLPIGTLTITGGSAHLEGLAEELGRLIGVGVRIGDPLARVRLGKKVRPGEQVGSLAVAIGLGIED